MVEGTQPKLSSACDALGAKAEALPVERRRALVKAVEDAILRRSAGDDPVVNNLLDILACDPDWSVRLEVARLLHLLDDDGCSRLAAVFRQDTNSYVRGHAERGLARQRKARRTSSRKRSEQRGGLDRLDELTRQ